MHLKTKMHTFKSQQINTNQQNTTALINETWVVGALCSLLVVWLVVRWMVAALGRWVGRLSSGRVAADQLAGWVAGCRFAACLCSCRIVPVDNNNIIYY